MQKTFYSVSAKPEPFLHSLEKKKTKQKKNPNKNSQCARERVKTRHRTRLHVEDGGRSINVWKVVWLAHEHFSLPKK